MARRPSVYVAPMSDGPTDAEVIEQVLDGDTDQFAVLVDRYGDEFARYAKYMIGSEDEAADVIQESLVRAFRSLRRCQDRTNFKGWLFRIVSNQCKTHITRRRRRSLEPLDAASEIPAVENPATDAEAEDLRRRVRLALQDLPREQREALVLKYIEGLSLPEMAEALSVSVPALKMRLLRARRELLARVQGVLV
ncbi:MAG TPA: RNA polymerase sigma factor [Gemmatimonadales bacterium]